MSTEVKHEFEPAKIEIIVDFGTDIIKNSGDNKTDNELEKDLLEGLL